MFRPTGVIWMQPKKQDNNIPPGGEEVPCSLNRGIYVTDATLTKLGMGKKEKKKKHLLLLWAEVVAMIVPYRCWFRRGAFAVPTLSLPPP